MENLSKMTIDDSSTSMYFSFNSTTAYKTVEAMESGAEVSCLVETDDGEQNLTLGAGEDIDSAESVQTIRKLSFAGSAMKPIPKNILKAYKALSSTPTKAQILRSVEVTRGSAAVDVCDLGLAFLDAPQECINEVLSDDKENQPQESQEIYSETSSEIVVSVIEKTQEEEKPAFKKVGFSYLPVLKGSGISNIRCTPKAQKPMSRCEPNLIANRPSRITLKRLSIPAKRSNQPAKENIDDIPKMINSILKISKDVSTKRKSFVNPEKPFNLLGKSTRMSIVKTTLNSPARKAARKSTSFQVGKNPSRQSIVPMNKRKSDAVSTGMAPWKGLKADSARKSMLSTSVGDPKKRIPTNSRKSMIPEIPVTKSTVRSFQHNMASRPSTSSSLDKQKEHTISLKMNRHPSGPRDDFICKVCSRTFRVSSLLDSHTCPRSNGAISVKQMSADDGNQCRYCDKKFAIPKALSNHLLQNCTKIPPGHKKKLLFPSDQPVHLSNLRIPHKTTSTLSSCDSLASNSKFTRGQIEAKSSDTNKCSMAPPPVNKIRKQLAHAGVYCTPSKQIPCNICKKSFTDILAYTEHSLSHSTAGNNEAAAPSSIGSIEIVVEMKNGKIKTEQRD